jgi:hypothetical protein
MSSVDQSFLDFTIDQVAGAGLITYRRMFSAAMVYCDGRPVLLLVDNTVFVKNLPLVIDLYNRYDKSIEIVVPIDGYFKPWCILDIEDSEFATQVTRLLAEILPLPKPKRKKNG